jgi:hypothetical protein
MPMDHTILNITTQVVYPVCSFGVINYLPEKLVIEIPKHEYLFGTHSTVSPKAVFGLDFGEIYQRGVLSIRLHGVSQDQVNSSMHKIHQFIK